MSALISTPTFIQQAARSFSDTVGAVYPQGRRPPVTPVAILPLWSPEDDIVWSVGRIAAAARPVVPGLKGTYSIPLGRGGYLEPSGRFVVRPALEFEFQLTAGDPDNTRLFFGGDLKEGFKTELAAKANGVEVEVTDDGLAITLPALKLSDGGPFKEIEFKLSPPSPLDPTENFLTVESAVEQFRFARGGLTFLVEPKIALGFGLGPAWIKDGIRLFGAAINWLRNASAAGATTVSAIAGPCVAVTLVLGSGAATVIGTAVAVDYAKIQGNMTGRRLSFFTGIEKRLMAEAAIENNPNAPTLWREAVDDLERLLHNGRDGYDNPYDAGWQGWMFSDALLRKLAPASRSRLLERLRQRYGPSLNNLSIAWTLKSKYDNNVPTDGPPPPSLEACLLG